MAGPLLEKYLKGRKGVTVENRRRILRLIENMTMGRRLGSDVLYRVHPLVQRSIETSSKLAGSYIHKMW